MGKKRKWIMVIVIGLVVCILAYFGLNRKGATKKDVAYVQQVGQLMNQGQFMTNRYSGVITAQQTTNISLDSSKHVESVNVAVGDHVEKGATLFTYETTEANRTLQTTKLSIEGLKVQNDAITKEIAQKQQELQSGVDEARKNELNDAIFTLQSNIRENQLAINQAQIDIQSQQRIIDASVVVAPVTGTIKAINEQGVDQNGQALPYIQISESGDLRVKGKVDEMNISSIQVGNPVLIRSRVDETKIWKGTVSEVSSEPETNNSQMGPGSENQAASYAFYVSLENSEGLLMGQHIYIENDLGQATEIEGIQLDQSYIVYGEDGQPFVWMEQKGVLKKQPVEVGEANPDTLLVPITSGLTKEDYIAWPMEYHEGMACEKVELESGQ